MRYLSRVGVCVLALHFGGSVHADEAAQKKMKILRKEVAVAQNLKTITDSVQDEISESGVETVSQINLFGKKTDIVKSTVQYQASEAGGLSYENDFYVKGKKVLAESVESADGSLVYSVEIPATEIGGDIFAYSLGIISVAVTSGLNYEGSLNAVINSDFLRTTPVIPTPMMNLVDASADVDIMAKGFIEGQARILFFKGAVGGALNLIDGQASAAISVTPATITKPVVAYDGAVHLLSGQLYGYIGSGMFKWAHYDFYKSKGYCFAFGESQCQE